MDAIDAAILFKSLAAFLILLPWFLLVKLIEWVRPKLPRNKVLDFMFKERGAPMASFLEPQQTDRSR